MRSTRPKASVEGVAGCVLFFLFVSIKLNYNWRERKKTSVPKITHSWTQSACIQIYTPRSVLTIDWLNIHTLTLTQTEWMIHRLWASEIEHKHFQLARMRTSIRATIRRSNCLGVADERTNERYPRQSQNLVSISRYQFQFHIISENYF